MVLRPNRLSERLRPAGALSASSLAGDRRLPWLVLVAAIAAAFPLILHLARGTTFSIDELGWFMTSPGLDVEGAFEPHNGHLILTTRLVYKAVLETLGSGYLPFLLLTIATTATLAVLLLVYLGRKVGPLVALAPVVVLVFFGSDTAHVATGNGFTVLLALACGIGAMLCLERRDRLGDVGACALLCLGVLTYSVAVPFVAAVGVLVLVGEDRWRRAWTFLVPALIYLGWQAWMRGSGLESETDVTLSNVLLLPSWGFQSLAAALSGLTGLGYEFGGERSVAAGVGPVLALLVLGSLAWRLSQGAVPVGLWATLTALVVLWLMGALSYDILRVPEDPRYMYPVAVGTLLVAAWGASGRRWSRGALIAVCVVAMAGLATNLAQLRDRTAELRSDHEVVRAEMSAIELAGERAAPELDPGAATEGRSFLRFPFTMLRDRGESPVDLYAAATDRYGTLGFAPDDLHGRREEIRARADTVLVAALGLELAAADAPGPANCLEVEGHPEAPLARFDLPPGSAVVLQPRGDGGRVAMRRFADETDVELGELGGGQAALLDLPDDGLPDDWRISAAGPPLLVCPVR